MRISHNEVFMLCKKSFEGIGLRPGETDDAADAIAWLESRSIPALNIAISFLEVYADAIHPAPQLIERSEEGHFVVDAGGNSCLLVGPLALELGAGNVDLSGSVTVDVRRIQHPLALLGLVENIARRGIGVMLQWSMQDQPHHAVHCIMDPYGSDPTVWYQNEDDLQSASDRAVITMSRYRPKRPPVNPSHNTIISPGDFALRFAQTLENGIEIEPADWRLLNQYAKRTLVEATEESRRRGAGEAAG